MIEVLSRLVSERGAPLILRSDNGPEFVSRALLTWITSKGIDTALIDPGKPWQNGATESFNGKFRDECLSLEWFRSRAEAKVVIETWRRHYNQVRPHSSLGYLTPAEFAARIEEPRRSVRQATGRTAAVCGASALRPVASPSRKGQTKAETRAVALKLSVVRRNRAGHMVVIVSGVRIAVCPRYSHIFVHCNICLCSATSAPVRNQVFKSPPCASRCVGCLEAANGSSVGMATNIEPERNCAAALGARGT